MNTLLHRNAANGNMQEAGSTDKPPDAQLGNRATIQTMKHQSLLKITAARNYSHRVCAYGEVVLRKVQPGHSHSAGRGAGSGALTLQAERQISG
jgi:hypothetical protein